MLGTKAPSNGACLELYSPFDFQRTTYSLLLSFLTLMYQTLVDKQIYFDKHDH